MSAETLESAERQAAADQAQLRIARSQATLGFGIGAPWLDAARRDAMLAALSTGKALVVSATFTSGLDGHVPSELTVQRVGSPPDAKSWEARPTWVAPADPAVPGLTFLGWVGEPDGLVAGDRLTASVAIGETLSGTVVPGSAVVIAGGDSWAYLRMADGAFIRTRIALGQPTAGGYFQTKGFEAGQAVVVAGAGLLLARETGGGGEED